MSVALKSGALSAPQKDREFHFTDADFDEISKLAFARSGISLGSSKRDLVYGRLARRLRALGLSRFDDYRSYLKGPEGENEIELFINQLTTNHTWFFREKHHFDHLAEQVARPFAAAPQNKRLRIWSSASSTGEEPYSIAMTLLSEGVMKSGSDVKVLATDIDSSVLARAREGNYPLDAMRNIPANCAKLFPRQSDVGHVSVPDEVKSLVFFKRLNLMDEWPMSGPFDVIFCRNVMIYFDAPTKQRLLERFTQLLQPGGFLYLGHAEMLSRAMPGLSNVGKTIYRRVVS